MSYVVSSVFSDVVAGGWIGKGEPVRTGIDVPTAIDLDSVSRSCMQNRGLVVQPGHPPGLKTIMENGQPLERQRMYALADIGDVYAAVAAMLSAVANEHGSGRVWLTVPLSYLHRRDAESGFVDTRIQGTDNSDRDEPYSFTPTGDGTRRILLGMYYFHEATGRNPTRGAGEGEGEAMSKAVDAGDALSELEQSLMDLNKHEHNTSGLEQLHAIQKQVAEDVGSTGLASDPWSELEKSMMNVIDSSDRPRPTFAKLTKAPSEPGRQYVQPVNPFPPLWSYDSKSPVLDGGVWLRSRPGEKHGPNETGASGPCDVDCKKCAHERIVAREAASKEPEQPESWSAQVEYREAAKPVTVGKYRIVKVDREAMGLPPVPVGEFSAPGEPLRVKVLEDGTFTVSKEQMYRSRIEHQTAMPDPLDQVIDGWRLRDLVSKDRDMQRHDDCPRYFTPAQRAAVSAYWSAQLRAKVEASRAAAAESEPSVRYCEVEPWE